MDTLRVLVTGFVSSKKFVGMMVGQLMLALLYINTHIPTALAGLALEQAELDRVEAYATRAALVLIAWIGAQGAADFGKNKRPPG